MQEKITFIENLVSTVEIIPTASIISRTIHQDSHVKVSLFAFAPGQELSEHTASVPAMIQILQGTCSLSVGEKKHMAGPGTWVFMPANTKHALIAETHMHMLLIMMQE